MEHRFDYRRGDFSVSFVGDRDYVEAMIARFVPPPQPAVDAPDTAAALPPPPTRAPAVHKNISVADFLALKEVTAPNNQILAIAYYLEKYEYLPNFDAEDLRGYLVQAEIDPQLAGAALAEHCRQGLLIDEGAGRYSLSFSGEQRVKYGDFPPG